MPEPIELYDITLDEVSLVDKGDCPEARIVFFKGAAGRVDKAQFAEFLRARMTDRVLSEIQMLAGTLGDAVAAAIFNNEGGDAVRQNLQEFTEAVHSVIDEWAAQPRTAEKIDRTKRVEADDVTSLAMRALQKILERRPPVQKRSDHRRLMTDKPVKKRSDAYADAERQAARAFPDEPNPQSRMHKYMQTEEGAEAYRAFVEADPDPAPAPDTAPVLKGQNAIAKATAEAEKLVAADPDRFPNVAAARAHVWRTSPDLAREYQEEAY